MVLTLNCKCRLANNFPNWETSFGARSKVLTQEGLEKSALSKSMIQARRDRFVCTNKREILTNKQESTVAHIQVLEVWEWSHSVHLKIIAQAICFTKKVMMRFMKSSHAWLVSKPSMSQTKFPRNFLSLHACKKIFIVRRRQDKKPGSTVPGVQTNSPSSRKTSGNACWGTTAHDPSPPVETIAPTHYILVEGGI